MIMLILFSCTSCGVKQNTDKQEVKKKITWEGDYPYANSTDIFCVEKNNLFSYDINGENIMAQLSRQKFDIFIMN